MKHETWIDIPEYESLYKISDLGRVQSLLSGKPIIMKPCIDSNGYAYVFLCKDKKRSIRKIHRLVWESFNGKTDLQVHHKIEGNKSDCRLSNLTIGVNRKNVSDYYMSTNKTSKYTGVTWKASLKKWVANIFFNKKQIHLGVFNEELDAAKAYIIALNTIKIYGQ